MTMLSRLKDLLSNDLKTLQKSPFYYVGLKFFQLGILFLAGAPAISFFLLISSSIIGSFNRPNNFFNDKFNYPLIAVAILMISNCLIITFIKRDIQSFEIPKIWIGLSNWLPFFWCFWGFQPFLESRQLRIKTSKLFIIGSIPVLLSGFSQYFLKIYGPYYFFNNLIIWYQRPLDTNNAVTGLFNNQNYAGAWLGIIFPFCLVFLIRKYNNKFPKLFLFILCLSFVYMIVLTSSRGAILSIFITLFLFSESNKNKFFALISLISIPVILNSIQVFSVNLQSKIYNFLPFELVKKTSLTNISNIDLFPRIEIWEKSFELIKSNPIIGYGAGSFEYLYKQSNGFFGDIQHSHNIFLELAINHGLPSSLIILLMMIVIVSFSWKVYLNQSITILSSPKSSFKNFDKAWIISFIIFFLIHIFDITYFDGRISTTAWILLSGMICIIKSAESTNKPDSS